MTGEQGLPKRIGHYHIRGLLGQGGMGRVYRAEQSGTRRIVALKVLQPGLYGGEARGRFEREVRVLGKLRHPGIAAVYEANTLPGEDGEQPYLAMELVEGRNLMDYVHEAEPDIRARLELVARVCDAVQAAHEAGVVHRDLKPSNILVDETGQPKVLDFGLARFSDVQDSVRTTTGQFLGTPLYMSPEQAGGGAHRAGASSDVYALGVIAYQMLVDRLPYELENRTLPDLIHTILEEEPTPLGSVDRRLRGEIETIVQKALYKEPSRRYQTAAELAEDIRRHLHDEPILARAPSTWYYLVKFTRRHRVFVAGVTTVFLILVVSLAVVVRALTRAVDAEADVRAARDDNLDLLVESTQLSGQRGQWTRMLATTDSALAAGHRDRVGLTMSRVEALISLSRAVAAEAALKQLGEMELTSQQRARMLLWEAELVLAEDPIAGRSRLEAALAAGLDGSDRHYALGMIAPHATVAVRELRAALRENPTHFRANTALTFLLLMLGRKEDAEARIRAAEILYPDALAVHFAHGFLAGVRGGSDDSAEWVRQATTDLGPEQAAIVRAAVEFASSALFQVEGFDPLVGNSNPGRAALSLIVSLSRISALQSRFIALGNDPRDLSVALPLPLVLSESLRSLPSVLMMIVATKYDAAADALRDISDRLPMAILHYIEAIVRYGRQDFRNAYPALMKAHAARPLTSALGQKPLILAAAAAWKLAQRFPDERELWLKRAADAVRPIHDMPSQFAWIVAGVALESGEIPAARRLCDIGIRGSPNSSPIWKIRARIADHDRAYPVVIEAARRFEELGGKDAKMDELKAKAIAKLAPSKSD